MESYRFDFSSLMKTMSDRSSQVSKRFKRLAVLSV
jgi:hypothetical protein